MVKSLMGESPSGFFNRYHNLLFMRRVEKIADLRDNNRVGISSNRICLNPISEEDVWRHMARLNDLKSLFEK